jgi:hypothetical protein
MQHTKVGRILCYVGFFFLVLVALLPAQAGDQKPSWFLAGIRIGLTGAAAGAGDFDAIVQEIYPSEHDYFPLYSQIGLGLEQRIPIGIIPGRLTFQELFLVSGLDQNFALPLLGLLVGYRFPFELEIGLGPEFTPRLSGEKVVLRPALMYTVAWYFNKGKASVPVMLVWSPLPPDRKMRITLLSGFSYGVRIKIKLPKREKKKTPFTY